MQLKNYLSLAKREFSNKKVEGWLIFYGAKVSPTDKKTAEISGFKLFDEKDLNLFYKGNIEFE
jgi:hypothetical protein